MKKKLAIIVATIAILLTACGSTGEPAVEIDGSESYLRVANIVVSGRVVPCIVMEQSGYAGGAISCDWDN